MGNTAAKGYADPIGGRSRLWIGDHTGPLSYTQWSAPSTGGDVLQSKYLGLSTMNFVVATGISVSGTYYVEAKLAAGSGASPTSAILVWYETASPGTQPSASTNLSTETVRLLCIGG